MNSHFFYPTASGSLGEARRLGCEETIVKRESENPAPHSNGQPFNRPVRSTPTILIAEDEDDDRHSDSRNAQMRVNQPPLQPQPRAQPARAPARVEAKPAQGGNPKNAPQPQGNGKRHP